MYQYIVYLIQYNVSIEITYFASTFFCLERSTICKNASTLHMQKFNDSLAKEPRSTQCANKCASWMLDTKDKKTDLQSIVKDKCKYLMADPCQRSYCSFSLMSRFLTAL
jgi:hypothetical protein